MTGAYVQVIPTSPTIALIRRVVRGVSLPLYPNSELHCTVLYCPKFAPGTDFYLEKSEHMCHPGPLVAYADRAEIWDSQGGSKIVVLKLRSLDLIRRHEFWKQQGLLPSFPIYQPHVTLCDNVKDPAQLEMLNRTVAVINMMIKEYLTDIPLTFRREMLSETKPQKLRSSDLPKRPSEMVLAADTKKKKAKKGSVPKLRQLKNLGDLAAPGLNPPGLDDVEERSMADNGFNSYSHKRLLDGLGKLPGAKE